MKLIKKGNNQLRKAKTKRKKPSKTSYFNPKLTSNN